MSEQEMLKLLQEYSERHVRWADKTLSQLSFYNNLLLTLGVGFLSFAYKDSKIVDLHFSLKYYVQYPSNQWFDRNFWWSDHACYANNH